MKKKLTVSKAKRKAWSVFSKWIRTRDTTKLGTQCFTCWKYYPIKSMHAGHFIPGRHPSYLFDERQVHAQCYHCNVGLKGAWPEYYKRMVDEYGQYEVNKMIIDKGKIKQFKVFELEEIYLKYKSKLVNWKQG